MITTLYFLNKFIFQWFFIRLAKVKGHGNYGFKYAFYIGLYQPQDGKTIIDILGI